MTNKFEYTQKGYLHYIIIFACILVLFISIIPVIQNGFWPTIDEFIILNLVISFFIFVILSSYQMRLILKKDELVLILGIGFIKRKYPLKKIQSACVKPIKSYSGIGIRFLGRGWLYNIKLGKAVEISYKNKTMITQFGFDQAAEISEHINTIILNQSNK